MLHLAPNLHSTCSRGSRTSSCYTELHHVTLNYTMLHCVTPCYTVLHHVTLCYTLPPISTLPAAEAAELRHTPATSAAVDTSLSADKEAPPPCSPGRAQRGSGRVLATPPGPLSCGRSRRTPHTACRAPRSP